MQCADDQPPVPRLQSSKHPSLRVDNDSKSREYQAGRLRTDDDDSSSSSEDSSQMGQSSDLPEAGQHREILHPMNKIAPKNGCLGEMLRFPIDVEWIGPTMAIYRM